MNGEPDTARVVSPVRGRVSGNLPQQCGKALGAYPTVRGIVSHRPVLFRRRGNFLFRKSLPQKLYRRVHGGGGHRAGLYYLLSICVQRFTGNRPGRIRGVSGVELSGRSHFQYACSDTLSYKLDVGTILQRGKTDGETMSL